MVCRGMSRPGRVSRQSLFAEGFSDGPRLCVFPRRESRPAASARRISGLVWPCTRLCTFRPKSGINCSPKNSHKYLILLVTPAGFVGAYKNADLICPAGVKAPFVRK